MKHPTIKVGIAAAALGTAGAVAATQLVQAGHTNIVLQTALDGRQEVGPTRRIAGDPNGRGEAYIFGIDGDPNTLCYVVTVSKIEPATMAHIHEGAAGTNGPVVANLAAPGDGNAADCLTEGEILPNGNPAFPTGEQVEDILADPEAYYVNVHNGAYPAGAVRGQLAPQG